MLQVYRFFRDEKGLEQTDIYYQASRYYQAHVRSIKKPCKSQ